MRHFMCSFIFFNLHKNGERRWGDQHRHIFSFFNTLLEINRWKLTVWNFIIRTNELQIKNANIEVIMRWWKIKRKRKFKHQKNTIENNMSTIWPNEIDTLIAVKCVGKKHLNRIRIHFQGNVLLFILYLQTEMYEFYAYKHERRHTHIYIIYIYTIYIHTQ